MNSKNNYKYIIDLTRMINERITIKKEINLLGNNIFVIKNKRLKQQQELAKLEIEIDKLVIDYNKK